MARTKLNIRSASRGEEFIEPIEVRFGESNLPERQHLVEHNDIIQLDDGMFAAQIKRGYDAVYARPFLWESAATVAEWLKLMETEDFERWKVLCYDPNAVEYIQAWRSYLTHMGKMGARVVFVFEHLDVFTVV